MRQVGFEFDAPSPAQVRRDARKIASKVERERAARMARKTDPGESWAAAREMTSLLPGVQRWVMGCVNDHPGLTVLELAQAAGISETRKLGRRLPELERKGIIRRVSGGDPCRISGRAAARWFPCPKAEVTP